MPLPEMVVIVDTREQPSHRWRFPCPWVLGTLDSGDYSIRGCEAEITIERKRSHELYQNTRTDDRARFQREYERLSTYRRAILIVEGTLDDIKRACPRQIENKEAAFRTVMQTLNSWFVRFGVAWFPAGNKENAQAMAYSFLRHYWRHRIDKHDHRRL